MLQEQPSVIRRDIAVLGGWRLHLIRYVMSNGKADKAMMITRTVDGKEEVYDCLAMDGLQEYVFCARATYRYMTSTMRGLVRDGQGRT